MQKEESSRSRKENEQDQLRPGSKQTASPLEKATETGNYVEEIAPLIKEMKEIKSTGDKVREWLNVFLTFLMVVVTGLLVTWASKQWETMDKQWKTMDNSVKETQEMNKETRKLAEETEKLVEYAKQQAEAARLMVISDRAKGSARLEVWQRNSFYVGSDDDRTKITLLLRNLSHRPTAIIDIYVRDKDGILEGRGYHDRIKLPIQIEPWGVKEVEFRIEASDEKRMTNILVRDIEDNEIVVVRKSGQTWTRAESKR